MTGDLGTAIAVLCLLAGCGVRLWRWITGQHPPRGKNGATAAQQIRLAVRRPAVDVPVDSEGRVARPNDDPLLQ